MPLQTEIMSLSATTAPIYGRYRKQGPSMVPTHPPYVDEALLVPRDGNWLSKQASDFTTSGSATFVTNYGGNSTPAWQLATGNDVTVQGVEIPAWWSQFAVVGLFSRPTAATGNATIQLQRQYSFIGDDFSGALNRTNSTQQTVDMALAPAFALRQVILDPAIANPARRPDSILPFAWWRFRFSRLATSDTYGAATLGFHGLAFVRTG